MIICKQTLCLLLFFVIPSQITLETHVELLMLFDGVDDIQPNWSLAFVGYVVLEEWNVGKSA